MWAVLMGAHLFCVTITPVAEAADSLSQMHIRGTYRKNLHWFPPELVLTPQVCKRSHERKSFNPFISIHSIFIPTRLCQFVYLITLPEDVVFRLCMASRDWRVVADLWSEGWLSDALYVLWMIMWLWLFYIPVLPQTESLYQACHIHTSLLERGWKAFLQFCNSWNCRSTPQTWQCIPNQTEGVTTIKVWGTRILFKHFWYSQYFYRSFPGPKHIGHLLYLYPTPLLDDCFQNVSILNVREKTTTSSKAN